MGRCEKCFGKGSYLDRACVADSCAHRGAVRHVKKDGKVTRVRQPVMPCPWRPCSCPAGASARQELKERIERQDARIALLDEVHSRVVTASAFSL